MNLLPSPVVYVSERRGQGLLDPYIQQYGRRLYGLCRTLCANPFDADDLYQETWLKAFRHFSQYDPARPFEPWLTQICVNTYRSVLRRAFRSPILPFRTTQEQDEALQSVPAPEAADYSDLHRAVDALPEKLRLTVILFYFRDMDITSTAAVLGIPPGTVKSRLNKARNKLKEVLEHESDLSF